MCQKGRTPSLRDWGPNMLKRRWLRSSRSCCCCRCRHHHFRKMVCSFDSALPVSFRPFCSPFRSRIGIHKAGTPRARGADHGGDSNKSVSLLSRAVATLRLPTNSISDANFGTPFYTGRSGPKTGSAQWTTPTLAIEQRG